jgi:SAM-dependent methyltransferase
VNRVADAIFENPRLAQIYDALDPDRSDLDAYLAMAKEFGVRSVLDIGCGTGTFALLLAEHGFEVTGIEPALASLAVARDKPGADRVRWLHGDATDLPPLQVDLVTMTANVAQAIANDGDWHATLVAARGSLRPGGRLVFETRDPARRAWEAWTREATYAITDIPGVGRVQDWNEVTEVDLPLVTFTGTCIFDSDGEEITSTSTLAFRERNVVEADLQSHGFVVEDVRDAPDRPGREFVFVARAEPHQR